jgi:ABC-type transport system involved in cytochrome c biogenesis ATPase subunit
MFDKMSVLENLHFSQKFSCFEGFEDLASSIANHVLVFMLHGQVEAISSMLCDSWKQCE